MLTKVTAYSQWASIDPLVLNVINPSDTDLFEVRNIDGLGSVKADVNTTPRAIPGESFVGTNVGKRNIVLTLGLNPDWNDWTFSRLRRFLDKFFMPQQKIRFVLETMEFSPVEISGYVESNEPNMFSKDPEHQISIICPDLYFRSVDVVTHLGQTDEDPLEIDYEGNVATGMFVRVSRLFGYVGADPTWIEIGGMDPFQDTIHIAAPGGDPVTDVGHDLFMNSVPGDKYVRKIPNVGGIVVPINLLNYSTFSQNKWPTINPGTDTFFLASDAGIQSWQLEYYNLFGSL